MPSFLYFVSHKLVLIDVEIAKTVWAASFVNMHIGGTTRLDVVANEVVIGINGWWVSVRGLADHAGSADKKF